MTLKSKKSIPFADVEKITDPTVKAAFQDVLKTLQDNFKNTYDDLNDLSTGATLYLGDSGTNGSWRLTVSGANLSVQKREAGAWVEKAAFTP